MKVKMNIRDLTGKALDYAVDRAANGTRYSEQLSIIRTSGDAFRPTTSWSKCGELMERLSISCYQSTDPETGKLLHWVGVSELVSQGERRGWIADDPRTAICRAIAAIAGDEIEIPDELLKKESKNG